MLRYKEIKNLLLQELSHMSPGDKLPSRPHLCKKLDTTRGTLDKAIKELEQEGFLSSKNGSGTYLVELFDAPTQDAVSWGIIIPDIMYSIYSGLVRGIENIAQKYGVNIVICNSDNEPQKQAQYIKRLMLSHVSGIIIVPVITNSIRENFQLYNQLVDISLPIIFCNRSLEGINVPVVTSNDFYGGYIATKHLIERGYRKIAYIADKKYVTSTQRCQGYISALIESGLEVNRKLISFDNSDRETNPYQKGYDALFRLLEHDPDIDAAFCFNDRVAEGVHAALTQISKKISGEFGLIGYDNSDICDRLTPRLTSVSYKNTEIGNKAAELMWKITTSQYTPDFEYYLFQPSIIVRQSCLGKDQLCPPTLEYGEK